MSYLRLRTALLRSTLGLALAATIPGRGLVISPVALQAESQPGPQAQGPSQLPAQPSLGEVARRLRAEKQKQSQPVKVYTNDNLPTAGNLSIVGPPASEQEREEKAASVGSPHEKHGAQYFQAQMSELQQQLAIHQGELGVLQQQLGQNQIQYYPNPNDTLHQEYSRADIDKLTKAINEKKQQIESDQQAISDLQDELRREGGDPRWLQAAGTAQSAPPPKPDLSGVKKNSEEYWRLRFSAARKALDLAQTQQKLTEDQLGLLQSQQARDVASPNAAAIAAQVAAKQSEVESRSAATAQAQQDLDALEQEFKQSGAPDEWSQPPATSTDNPGPQ